MDEGGLHADAAGPAAAGGLAARGQIGSGVLARRDLCTQQREGLGDLDLFPCGAEAVGNGLGIIGHMRACPSGDPVSVLHQGAAVDRGKHDGRAAGRVTEGRHVEHLGHLVGYRLHFALVWCKLTP
jgi:hypothetical protein